jgi:hypothetical protein
MDKDNLPDRYCRAYLGKLETIDRSREQLEAPASGGHARFSLLLKLRYHGRELLDLRCEREDQRLQLEIRVGWTCSSMRPTRCLSFT